jgi:type IV secretory pathway ATPase VirB11/archaellum biosynthesis ATPase
VAKKQAGRESSDFTNYAILIPSETPFSFYKYYVSMCLKNTQNKVVKRYFSAQRHRLICDNLCNPWQKRKAGRVSSDFHKL